MDFSENLANNEERSQLTCENQQVPAPEPVLLKRKRSRPGKTDCASDKVDKLPAKRKILSSRKAKEGRDFTIYAIRVNDTSF